MGIAPRSFKTSCRDPMDSQDLLLPPQNNPTKPRTLQAMPPMSIQVVLFVGEPVNVRETSELNELFELIPKTIRTIPTANKATANPIANPLFITLAARMYRRSGRP